MPEPDKPAWWTNEHDSAWDRVKATIRKDWEKAKHAFTQTPAKTKYEDVEHALRYGYGARRQYGQQSPEWTEDMERRLASEWGTLYPDGIGWDSYRSAVRAGWDHEVPGANVKKKKAA